MDSLPAIENVVRMIFPLTMIREGELLPAAFRLREQESIGGIPLEGKGTVAFETLRIGEEANYHLIAIRRRLVEIAKRRMTSTSQLLDFGKSR